MDALCFQPSLSMEEIEENFKDFDLFAKFIASLEEVLAYTRGETPPSIIVHELGLPDLEPAGEPHAIQQS